MILHFNATAAALKDEAHEKSPAGGSNPNRELVEKLIANGVEVWACGQSVIRGGNPLSAVLRMPVTERWEVHAERLGSWTDGLEDEKVRPFVRPGTHFMITPNLEIGCRMGWGLTQDAAAYFVDSGLGRLRKSAGGSRRSHEFAPGP